MAEQQLKRVLGTGFSVAACVGYIIGLGIMRTPGEIAETITDPRVYMGLWIIGGSFTLLTVLVVGELIAETPKSGGIYALVAHAFGPYAGFVIGWVTFLQGVAGAALKTVVLMEYFSLLAPSVSALAVPGALVITTAFAALQISGVRLGGNYHQTAVVCVGLMMIALIVALFLGDAALVSSETAATTLSTTSSGLAGLGVVIAATVFTYNGWAGPSFFGGEIEGGGRAVALGALRGTLIVFGLYLLLNLALVKSVPLPSLSGHDLALARALELLYGIGTPVVMLAIVVLLMHQNLNYMTSSRVLYALSVDDLGTKRATSVSDKGTPTGAVILTWSLVVVLILVGGFQFLLSMTSMLIMFGYIAAVVGVFRLRRLEPDANRPYRAWGFPMTGYMCVIGYAALTLIVAISQPDSTAYTLGLILVSAPAYLWLRARRQLAPTPQLE